MDPSLSQPFADILPIQKWISHFLMTIAITAARPSAILLVIPIFLRASLPNLVKIVIAITFVLPIIQIMMGKLPDSSAYSTAQIVGILGKELLFGMVLGLLLAVPFLSIQAVGEMMDNQRGVSSLPIEEPATQQSASSTAILLSVASIASFFMFNGLRTLIEILYESYVIWPITEFVPDYKMLNLDAIFGMLDKIMRYMMVISSPAVILLFLVDLALLLLARAAPSFNIPDLSPSLKSDVFIIFIIMYLSFLIGHMNDELGTIVGIPNILKGIKP
jgi:type III secretion protein T